MTRLLAHARQNFVAYLALFVALGGTSYAALTINGSQIRNRSIDAVKLNPQSIAASVKAWAIVQAGRNSAAGLSCEQPGARLGNRRLANRSPGCTGGSAGTAWRR